MGTLAEVKDVVVGGNDELHAECSRCVEYGACSRHVPELIRLVTHDGLPTGVPRLQQKIVKCAQRQLSHFSTSICTAMVRNAFAAMWPARWEHQPGHKPFTSYKLPNGFALLVSRGEPVHQHRVRGCVSLENAA